VSAQKKKSKVVVENRCAAPRYSPQAAVASAAVGFLVLAGSELTALREFGVLLAASVVLSYLASRAVVWALPPGGRAGETSPVPAVTQLSRKVGTM